LRLIVTIPAFNEEATIGDVIRLIPRNVVEDVKIIVVDDGSTDNTVNEAWKAGADKVVSFGRNMGLAYAFKKGLEAALEMNPDIIVNIDADGQYDAGEIPRLIRPIIEGEADIVLGSRFKGLIEHMPKRKKWGNILATKVVGFLAGVPISDAQTGFRAFSREAALKLNILSDYTYVQETVIQAAYKGLRIVEVPCTFRRRKAGDSRFISSLLSYAKKSGLTILRTYINYRPLRTFLTIGGALSLIGAIIGLRVLIHFFLTGMVSPYIPSAILTAILVIVGFQIIVLGLIADMIGAEGKLMEEILYRLKGRCMKCSSKENC
jgi:glycosyltransferase involved in cell wall biosynthesis